MSVLVLNAGSSTLKFVLFQADGKTVLLSGGVDWKGSADQASLAISAPGETPSTSQLRLPTGSEAFAAAVRAILAAPPMAKAAQQQIGAVGHRVVQGGPIFHESVRIDDRVVEQIDSLSGLAPLHNPPAVHAIRAARESLPQAAHVACFDTAFFHDLPEEAFVYPLPYEWWTDWKIRRYGAHGISYSYCVPRATELLGGRPNLRLITCHLGNGCSATATLNGRPIATTMGLTPLEGLMMGGRSGSIDPAILLHVQRHHGLSVDALEDILNHQSGLKGVSGVSSDFREVEKAAAAGNPLATLALTIYARRLRATIGELAALLGGLDALTFTAGVGEHAAGLRARVCEPLKFLGITLDAKSNEQGTSDRRISSGESAVAVLVLHTQEERVIAAEALRFS